MNPALGHSITITKPVMTADGRWISAPYDLTRHPDGRLSDRPALTANTQTGARDVRS